MSSGLLFVKALAETLNPTHEDDSLSDDGRGVTA